ncbi:MAG: hypothetical protein VKJ85_07925 [Prochlorothrix sp.]|nr:hypothetical protein [Prochlorothrix sp.]
MEKLLFSKLTKADLAKFVSLEDQGIKNHNWLNVESVSVELHEAQQLQYLQSHLLHYDTHLMNESTIWARAIYPLLLLAEKDFIQAWAEVSLQAQYTEFELEGIADGVLAKCVSGFVEIPYLVIVEAKKGLESQNPVYQLYGQLLAVARLHWEANQNNLQTVYGCYTIADVWKFVKADIRDINSHPVSMRTG